ncbi:hypothetical protein IWX65_003159 [Arthrobacter sp. CAN_A214]|uniref:hypothetical protein n=1 Tax=Arthrobacter sp. CAN_A214 TaxID=2787720 RepID=UPI0018C95EAD
MAEQEDHPQSTLLPPGWAAAVVHASDRSLARFWKARFCSPLLPRHQASPAAYAEGPTCAR